MSLFSTVRAWFRPSVIEIIPPDPLAEPGYRQLGLYLIALDDDKSDWSIGFGLDGARMNRSGAWYIKELALAEPAAFVFTLNEARGVAMELISSL